MSDEDDDNLTDQLNDEADIAADFLEELLDIADYEGDIEMGIRNGRPVVQIVADDDTDIKNLIGEDGQVVEALQMLTRLAVQQKTGERSRLILDVDGYLTRRRKRIRQEVLDAVDEVRETGEPVSLDPMNSFERKIVHDIVREEGLRSRSHDAEPNRYVTIYLKPAAADDEDEGDELDEDEEVNEEEVNEEEANEASSSRRAAVSADDRDDEVNEADEDVEDMPGDEEPDEQDAEDVDADEEHDDEVTDADIADEEAEADDDEPDEDAR